MASPVLTPRQAAAALGSSESSVKRWCDRGLLRSVRTPGGHRRIELDALLAFARERGLTLSEGAAAGVAHRGGRDADVETLRGRMLESLVSGDAQGLARQIEGAHRGGRSHADICDELVAPAMRQLGELWQTGRLHIYQEHRATQLVLGALGEMSSRLSQTAADAALAVCAAPAHDPYSIAVAMTEVALRERGWRTAALGADTPAQTLQQALRDLEPALLVLSVSALRDVDAFVADYAELRAVASELGVAIALGGRALDRAVRGALRFDFYGESLAHLTAFADGLAARGASSAAPPA